MQQQPWKRKKDGALFAGVCNGFAEAYKTNVDLVRFITVLLFFVSGGTVLLVYIILAIALPLDTNTDQSNYNAASKYKKEIPSVDDDEYAFDPEDYKYKE